MLYLKKKKSIGNQMKYFETRVKTYERFCYKLLVLENFSNICHYSY